jgi:hypothetical protein
MLRVNFFKIQTGHCVKASPEAIWDVLTDTTRWVLWGPSITAAECSERYIRKGSTGRVRTSLGFWLPFLVTHFDHGRFWSWRVGGIPATGHRVEALSPDKSCVLFEVPIFAAPYIIVCRIAAKRIADLLNE